VKARACRCTADGCGNGPSFVHLTGGPVGNVDIDLLTIPGVDPERYPERLVVHRGDDPLGAYRRRGDTHIYAWEAPQ
jgi:hypothetical protein